LSPGILTILVLVAQSPPEMAVPRAILTVLVIETAAV
jgi:hypothetical protein